MCYVALDSYRRRRVPLATFGGELVARELIEQADPRLLQLLADQVQSRGVALIEDSRRPGPVAHSLTYAPRISHEPAAPALLGAPEAPTATAALPDAAALADMLPTLPPGRLIYGILPGNTPLIMSFGQAYHALAAGDTRTGKSNYLDSIITQLHHQAANYTLRLMIGDFKREMAATWRRSALVETVETDPAVIADMLIELANGPDGILARYSRFETLGNAQQRVIRNIADWCKVTGEKPQLTFCVIDELNALIEAADEKDELASALKVVLQTGAGAGVYVLGGAQYLTSSVFGRDGSKQFTTRAMFGAHDPTAARVVFGQGKIAPETQALLTGQPGRGLIRTAGQAQPVAFQALRCDENDILEAVRLLPGDRPTLDLGGNSATTQRPRKAAATGATDCEKSPNHAEIVKRLKAQGQSKTKIIEVVWGVKAGGGSAAYKNASAEYDAIVNT